MSRISSLLQLLKSIGLGLYAAILPSPERDGFANAYDVDVARWSLLVGVVEMFVGFLLYIDGALAFMAVLGSEQTQALMENYRPGMVYAVWSGTLGWLAWHLQPEAWLYTTLALTGSARFLAFLITREAFGEPIVWATLRAYQTARDALRGASRRRKLGPERPDSAIVEDGCDLVVVSSREKDGWDELATIQVGDRFYRLIDVEERLEGRWISLAYRLREAGRNEPIRALVRSDVALPDELPGGPCEPPSGCVWVFAYGPNMLEERLREAVPSARSVGAACLAGHLLRFYKRDDEGSGTATVIDTSNPGDKVWGVVQECAEGDGERIDRAEGIGEGYRRNDATVVGVDDQEYRVRLYVAEPDQIDTTLAPSRPYLESLIEACRRLGFPRFYTQVLERTRTQ